MRKAQQYGQFLIYVLALLILAVVIIAGINIFGIMNDKKCKSESFMFSKDLTETVKGIRHNEQKSKNFQLPCKADRVIFVDKEVDAQLGALSEYPMVNDAIGTSEDNVFLLEGRKIKESIGLSKVDVDFPYFECYLAKDGMVDINFKGKSGRVDVDRKNTLYDCGFPDTVPVELQEEDINEILKEIEEEFMKIESSEVVDNCDIKRTVAEDGANTEITLSKDETCEFTFFEKIPKCAISSIQEAIDNSVLHISDYEIIEDDPLLMWDFEQNEENYTYMIKKLIEDGCKEEFMGLPVKKIELDEEISEELEDSSSGLSDDRREILEAIQQNAPGGWGIIPKLKKIIELFKETQDGDAKERIEKLIERIEKHNPDSVLIDKLEELKETEED